MENPGLSLLKIIERIVLLTGKILSISSVLLMITITLQVFLRYVFGMGLIALEELQWHFYAVMITMGFSYVSIEKAHVCVDVFSRRFSPKTTAWLEIGGIIFLLFPFLTILLFHSFPFLFDSFSKGESSPSPGGLPFRWIVKSLIPFGCMWAILAGFVRIGHAWKNLRQ